MLMTIYISDISMFKYEIKKSFWFTGGVMLPPRDQWLRDLFVNLYFFYYIA